MKYKKHNGLKGLFFINEIKKTNVILERLYYDEEEAALAVSKMEDERANCPLRDELPY